MNDISMEDTVKQHNLYSVGTVTEKIITVLG